MKKTIVTILALLFVFTVMAQQETEASDDFGFDISVAAEKEFLPGFDVSVSADIRTCNDTKDVERYVIGADLGYKFYNTKKFDVKMFGGFEYMWMQKFKEVKMKYNTAEGRPADKIDYNINDGYWRQRYRISAGLAFDYSPSKRWNFQLKETFQWSHYFEGDSIDQEEHRFVLNKFNKKYREDIKQDKKAIKYKDHIVLRSKFTVEYNIKGIPVNPFASVDYGCGLDYTAHKWKYSVGTDYNINKKNRLTVYYRYQTEDDDDEPNGHIVGLGYKIKF